jgi:hypothetical protein
MTAGKKKQTGDKPKPRTRKPKREGYNLTVNVTHVEEPSPLQAAAWRKLWDRLLCPSSDDACDDGAG